MNTTTTTKKVPSGKTHSTSKATLCRMNSSSYMAINPSTTPSSAYMKKTK